MQESKEVRLVKTYNRSNVVEVLDVLVKLIILAGTIGGIILFLAFLLSTLDRASLPFNQLLTLIIAFILMALSTMLSASLLKAISEILDTLYDIRDKLLSLIHIFQLFCRLAKICQQITVHKFVEIVRFGPHDLVRCV